MRESADGDRSQVAMNKTFDGPVDWFEISGQERLEAWRGLADFVEKLVFRYDLGLELRPCWWQHGEAVEELTALWHVRQYAYRMGAAPKEAMYWQDTLYKSRDRLRDIFVSCCDGHIDARTRRWMSHEVRMEFRNAIDDDVANPLDGR